MLCRHPLFCFFFSSRRRHTRCSRDWSSDVCSSDLESHPPHEGLGRRVAVGSKEAHRVLHRRAAGGLPRDRKSTRLNSSHGYISYAVFCLKKKKNNKHIHRKSMVSDRNAMCTS